MADLYQEISRTFEAPKDCWTLWLTNEREDPGTNGRPGHTRWHFSIYNNGKWTDILGLMYENENRIDEIFLRLEILEDKVNDTQDRLEVIEQWLQDFVNTYYTKDEVDELLKNYHKKGETFVANLLAGDAPVDNAQLKVLTVEATEKVETPFVRTNLMRAYRIRPATIPPPSPIPGDNSANQDEFVKIESAYLYHTVWVEDGIKSKNKIGHPDSAWMVYTSDGSFINLRQYLEKLDGLNLDEIVERLDTVEEELEELRNRLNDEQLTAENLKHLTDDTGSDFDLVGKEDEGDIKFKTINGESIFGEGDITIEIPEQQEFKQVQADWEVQDSEDPAFIKHKPNIPNRLDQNKLTLKLGGEDDENDIVFTVGGDDKEIDLRKDLFVTINFLDNTKGQDDFITSCIVPKGYGIEYFPAIPAQLMFFNGVKYENFYIWDTSLSDLRSVTSDKFVRLIKNPNYN